MIEFVWDRGFVSVVLIVLFIIICLWNIFMEYMYGVWDSMTELFIKYNINIQHHGTFIWTFSVYWIPSSIYTVIDVYRWPSFIFKYKIDKTSQITSKDIYRTVKSVLVNQLVIYLGFYFFAYSTLLRHEYKSCAINYWRFLLQFLFCSAIQEIGFYYTHRLLHFNKIYKYIHSKHHKWTIPTAMASVYCHPFEHLISNIAPILLGPQLLSSHLAFLWFWLAMSTLYSVHTHSGFHLPLTFSPQFHDYHHSHPTQNFGTSGLLDSFHQTDTLFKKSKESQRNKIFLTFRTPYEVFK